VGVGFKDGHWNYITAWNIDGKTWYVGANNYENEDPKAGVSPDIINFSDKWNEPTNFPDHMWCVTCKKQVNLRKAPADGQNPEPPPGKKG
jgi:hypothetical protein